MTGPVTSGHSPFLTHSHKWALVEFVHAMPDCAERQSILQRLSRSGENDGRVAFSAAEENYIRGSLINSVESRSLTLNDERLNTPGALDLLRDILVQTTA